MSRRPRPLPELRVAAGFYRFRESLFFLPALLVLVGAGPAEATATLDRALGTERSVPLTLDVNSNAATWLLSTVAGATITTAGVVFSLTVVSLQLASSQFSPRVMHSFTRDRLSQVVIGSLIATFVYSVLTLRHVPGEATAPAPRTVAGPEGRVLLRPWDLSHDEYVAHAFDQLRQAAPSQSQVVATLLRVLRMLARHARSSRRPELVPVLQSQSDRLLDAVRLQAGLHPEEVARLEDIAHAPRDPADHGAGGHGDDGVADGPR